MSNFKVYHNPGYIVRDVRGFNKIYYLDQLCPELVWKYYSSFSEYIRRKYGLNQQEYYNLVVYGDKDKSPICPICGIRPIKFKNINLGYSYYHNCGDKNCKSETYSISNRNIQLKRLESGEHHFIQNDYKKMMSDFMKIRNHEYSILGIHPCQDIKNNIIMQKGRVLKFGSPDDIIHYYFARCGSHDCFKLGVTVNIEAREGISKETYMSNVELYGFHIIKSGSRRDIADLEASVKIKFNSKSEYFPISMFKEIINYIKSII